MALTLSRLTREYIYFDVTTEDDLTASTAQVAFMDDAGTVPTETDWNPADLVLDGAQWKVRILVGPGDVNAVDLTPPTEALVDYQVWISISDDPELVVRKPGTVTVE